MVGTIIAFLLHENPRPLKVTLVVPRLSPAPSWWPKLGSQTTVLKWIGETGDEGCFWLLRRKGIYAPLVSKSPLYAARLVLPH
jgi:hypothetical protein